jgi:spore coat polysaccharide biosynthesis protein SpsF
VLAIIQARCSSKRFPNKVLKKIYGKPLIHHVILKLLKSKKITKIIVATSNHKSDDKLAKYLKKIKVELFRGSLKNVAKRFLDLVLLKKKKFFLRISGDSPLIDFKIVDQAISIFKKNKRYDIVTNICPRSFPKGQSVEILKTEILKNNILKMSKNEKEHVTKYFYKYSKKFYIKNFRNKIKTKSIKLAIDNKNDLAKILNRLDKKQFESYSIND